MAKLLVTVWPYPGAVRQLAAIADAVRARGHDVGFYTGAAFRERIERQGHRWFGLQPSLESWFQTTFRDPEGPARHWSRPGADNLTMMREFFLARLDEQVEDLDRIHRQWDFDAILCEFAMWGPRVVYSEARGVPLVLFDTPSTTIPGPDVGVPGLDMAPPRGLPSRLAVKAVRLGFDLAVRRFRQDVSVVRARYGLGPVRGSVMEMAAELPLVLVPSCPAFDYERRDLPACFEYVGSCLSHPPLNEPLDWLDAQPPGRPRVHVSEGTVYVGEPLILRAAVEALGGGRDYSVVITTGSQRPAAATDLAPLPENVFVRPYIPHADLIPRMDAVVTHGGQGAVTCSLVNGVPLVAVPLMWDQLENARRVEFTGAGVRLPLVRLTAKRLREAVDSVLEDEGYRRNARRLSMEFARYKGPALAAELIERTVLFEPELKARAVG